MFNYKILDKNWVVFCLIVLVIFAVFGQTLWFDYIQLDEGILILNNKFFISDISNFFEAFKHDINFPSNVAPYYRPLFIVSFILNTQLGSSPLAYHIGNILLHIVAAYFVFWLFVELGYKRNVSFISSVLFAVHPAVTPVVAWVPGRIEAILTIFITLSLILFIRFLRTGKWQYLIGLFMSFFASLLTKEVAVALLPVLLFYYLAHKKEYGVQEKSNNLTAVLLLGLATITVSWFFVRESIIAQAKAADMSFLQMLSTLWSNSLSAVLYIGKAVLPFNLTALPVLEDSTLIYGFIAIAILAVCWFLGKVRVLSLGALGFVWFIVFLAPSLIGFYPTEKMVFFEHRLYLPMIGVLIFFAGLLSKSRYFDLQRRQGGLLVGLIAVVFVILSFNYSGVYKDRFSFWQRAVADSPKTSQAHKGLATAYLMDGKFGEAELNFVKALELNPKEKGIHLILGLYYLDQNRYPEAREELEKEIESDPRQFIAHHALGRISAQAGNLKKAEEYFLKALEINPDYILAHQDLVVLYFSQNKHPKAIAEIKELLKLQSAESLHPQILKILEIYGKEAASKNGF